MEKHFSEDFVIKEEEDFSDDFMKEEKFELENNEKNLFFKEFIKKEYLKEENEETFLFNDNTSFKQERLFFKDEREGNEEEEEEVETEPFAAVDVPPFYGEDEGEEKTQGKQRQSANDKLSRSSNLSSGLLQASLNAITKSVSALEAAVAARRLRQPSASVTAKEDNLEEMSKVRALIREALQETLPRLQALLDRLEEDLAQQEEERKHLKDQEEKEKEEVEENVSPIFCGYQLLGDSLLLRFAEQVLGETCIYGGGMRRIGLCVSGQTSHQLLCRVAEGFAPLGTKAVVLIGTNDMLQGVPVEEMKSSVENLINILEHTMTRIVLLTIPPIPKLESENGFWFKHSEYNNFLHELATSRKKVCVVDAATLFLDGSFKSDLDCFERLPVPVYELGYVDLVEWNASNLAAGARHCQHEDECRLENSHCRLVMERNPVNGGTGWYNDHQRREDLIHLNRTGLLRLRNHLINCQELY